MRKINFDFVLSKAKMDGWKNENQKTQEKPPKKFKMRAKKIKINKIQGAHSQPPLITPLGKHPR